MPEPFDSTSFDELYFVNLFKNDEYGKSISEHIHFTHITLDEFGKVPMYPIFLDNNEIDDIPNEYVIDDEEPFAPNDDRYYVFALLWKQSKVFFEVPDNFDSSKLKWIIENYYYHDWGNKIIAFKPCEIEYNG
jgi:hypothetical protein